MKTVQSYLALDRQQSAHFLGSIFAMWAIMLGIMALLAALYVSLQYSVLVPFEDQWSLIQEAGAHSDSFPLSLLWAQHNEHRLPFAKLLLLADLYWFRGQNISIYFEIYALQFFQLVGFLIAFRYVALWPRWMVALGGGAAMFFLFWPLQFQSFISPFGVEVILTYVSASLATIAMALAITNPGMAVPLFAASLAAAFISEGSLANGLLLWPLLLSTVIKFRMGRPFVLALMLTGIVCTAIYLVGYQNPPIHAKPSDSLGKLDLVAQYLLIYFGAPWAGVDEQLGQMLASAGLVAVPALYLSSMFRSNSGIFEAAMLSLCMFLLGTGFVTALGRVNFPLIQAASSRYQTSALLFWLCLFIYLIDRYYRRSARAIAYTVPVLLLIASAILPSYQTALSGAEEMKGRANTGELPILADVKDDRSILQLIVPPDLVFQEREFLKRNAAGFYADHRSKEMGQPFHSLFQQTTQDRCIGAFDGDRRILDEHWPGWELTGWGWDRQAGHSIQDLVAVTADGHIEGIGATRISRLDVRNVHPEISDSVVGWLVYLRGGQEFKNLKLYGVTDSGKACLITPPVSVPKSNTKDSTQ